MEEHAPKLAPMSLRELLKSSILFHEADDAALDFVAQHLEAVTYRKGDPIIVEGEVSDHVYFLNKGTVEIVKYRPEIQQVSRLAVLKPGAHFSEFSVLNHSSKSASAFALEDCELYRLDGESFLNVMHRIPSVARCLVNVLAELNYSSVPDSFVELYDPSMITFSVEIPRLVPIGVWKKFGVLPLNYHAGVLLFAAKDPHRPEFFDFCKTAMPNVQLSLVMISERDFEVAFKHLQALYTSPPQGATAHTSDGAEAMDARTCIHRSPYFEGISEDGLATLEKMFELVEYKEGQILFQPGDTEQPFFLIVSGQVELSRPHKDNPRWCHITKCDVREGISDVAILANKPFRQRARAVKPTKVLKLRKEIFLQLLTSGQFCLNVAKVLARRLQTNSDAQGLKFYEAKDKQPGNELLNLIPRQIMQQHHVVPLELKDNEITLGTVDPANEALYSIAGRYLRGYRLNLVLITAENFKAWVAQDSPGEKKPRHLTVAKPDTTNAAVMELNKLLLDGFETRASDLHLEPTGTGYSVRYRVDGVLNEIANKIPREQGEAIINRIKVLGHMDITNHLTPQDGQLKIKEGELVMTARVATTPTKQGEGAVLRLIRNRSSAAPLAVLVPDTRVIRLLKSVARHKQGLFLVTGPTGSGKTSTLYSMINELNRVDVKIISLEDPIELEINGITQIEINDKQGLTFERAIKSTLRQDPDIMMIGEIRDAESAKIVFEAALSGHLVISTLHTNNSFGVKDRLKEIGVPSGTMAAGLIGAMAQRLVRGICKKCRTSRPATAYEQELLMKTLGLKKPPAELWHGRGCAKCGGTGYHGRLPIMEVWKKNRKMEDLLIRGASTEELLLAAREEGFETLYEFALKMALHGLTTIDEVERCMAGSL